MDEQWCLLLFEFWLYALRRPAARERLASLYRDFRGQLAALLEPLATAELPAREIASVVIALYQGLSLQRHSDGRARAPTPSPACYAPSTPRKPPDARRLPVRRREKRAGRLLRFG